MDAQQGENDGGSLIDEAFVVGLERGRKIICVVVNGLRSSGELYELDWNSRSITNRQSFQGNESIHTVEEIR